MSGSAKISLELPSPNKMKRLPYRILQIVVPALTLSAFFTPGPATADSVIRISGDRTTKISSDPVGGPATEPSQTPAAESRTIRITGSKSGNEQPSQPERHQTPSAVNGIRIIGDKSEAVQKKVPEQTLQQQAELKKAEEERKVSEKAERERLAHIKEEQENEAARKAAIEKEQELLAARKAEEQRQAAEKAEQEKAAADALLQAAIIKEQEQLAARKKEEMRIAAEKAEQERIAVLKAMGERQAAAKRDFVEKTREAPIAPQQTRPNMPSADAASTVITNEVIRMNPATAKETKGAQPSANIWNLYLTAKENDPALGRTEARVTGSKADSDLLFSVLMPHLNSSAGVKQISQSLKDYGNQDASYNYTALNYNVTAQMTLLHIPTLYSLSAAAAALGAEQAGVAVARQNLIVKFTDSYFALLKAQTDKQIAIGEINRLQQVLDQSQAFLKAGTGDIISVYEAQSRLDSAGADLTKSESTLRLAEQKLSSQVGKPVSEIVNYLPPKPTGPEPDDLDWWVAAMEREQPLVRQAREGLAQISEQRKAAKAEYLPILQASGGYDVNRGTAALPTAEVRQWFVGATLSLPLYSGGETSAKVRRALASEEERRRSFDETMDQQRENVKQAFFNLRYNISLIKALDQRKASAEIQLAAVKKGRKIGTRNAIDVLNAEQAYSLALRDHRYALYDNIIRIIQLKSAAGILAETDVSRLSEIEAPPPGSELMMIISQVSL